MATYKNGNIYFGPDDPTFTPRNEGKENPFSGTPYEDMWNNNPYADLYYDPSTWDKIGLSNKAKDANSEYERLYNEYIAGIYDQQRIDEYNSPSAESARMREAGLNPDILGLKGSSTDAMAKPDSGMNPALNGQAPAQNAFSVITSVLGFAISTLQQINAIKGLSLDNSIKSMSNLSMLEDVARPHIVSEYARRFSGSTVNDWTSLQDLTAQNVPRSLRSRYKHAFTALLNSSQFTASRDAYEQLSADDKAMRTFVGGMIELELQAKKHNYKGSIAKAMYDQEFYSPGSGSFDRGVKSSEGWLKKWRNEYYKKQYDLWKDGSILAGLLLIGSASFSGSVSGSASLNLGSNSIIDMVLKKLKK